MRRVWIVFGVAAVGFAILLWWALRPSPDRRAAANIAQLATTPRQKALWQAAADNGLTPGLSARRPPIRVSQIQRPPAPSPPPVASDVNLPDSVPTGVRLVASTGLRDQDFSKNATVVSVDRQRLVLEVDGQTLDLRVKVDGGLLNLDRNQPVQLEYRVRPDRARGRRIVGVVANSGDGDGVVQVTEGDVVPVNITLSSFGLKIEQDRNDRRTVHVASPTGRADLTAGKSAQLGSVHVTVMGTSAPPGPTSGGDIEGSAYSVVLLAWRRRNP